MKLQPGKEQEYENYKTNNADPYGSCVVRYGETWANLMEARLTNGERLTDIAQTTSHEADNEGITGFMYGYAVKTLAYFWQHGEELRQWHNISTQIGNEGARANENGGVLNPAIINIG